MYSVRFYRVKVSFDYFSLYKFIALNKTINCRRDNNRSFWVPEAVLEKKRFTLATKNGGIGIKSNLYTTESNIDIYMRDIRIVACDRIMFFIFVLHRFRNLLSCSIVVFTILLPGQWSDDAPVSIMIRNVQIWLLQYCFLWVCVPFVCACMCAGCPLQYYFFWHLFFFVPFTGINFPMRSNIKYCLLTISTDGHL